jgi:ribosomal protein S18 acetylase RimI-like enzyme
MNIREATKSDYDNVHHIQKQVHEIHTNARPDQYRMAQATLDKMYFEGLIESESSKVILLEQDERVVAYTILNIKQPTQRPIIVPNMIVFMDDFGVDEPYKGKGIGEKLFTWVVNFANEVGASSLELAAWGFNEDAIKFYEKMGMKTKLIRMEMKVQ